MDVLKNLNTEFLGRLQALLDDCANAGAHMTQYFGLRDPIAQGKLWRQSRTRATIDAEVDRLRAAGALFLANCIVSAGPQSGDWATNAIPGNSWHQWGEAMDCYWLRNNNVCWDTKIDGALNGYRVYMNKAEKHGLTAIGLTMGKDFGHVQLRPESAPHQTMTFPQIDAEMRKRFPGILGAATGD